MRRSVVLLLAALGFLAGLSGFAGPQEQEADLKLVVMLRPATGAVPLAPGEPNVYTFEVHAFDEAERMIKASDQVFVRQGQTRRVHRKFRSVEVKGVVSLLEGGTARYQAQLLEDGRRVAATEASILLDARR